MDTWKVLLVVGFVVGMVSTQGLPPPCLNGMVYPDRNVCECFTCWSGDACDVLLDGCLLSCETNEGFVQTEYWADVQRHRPMTEVDSAYRTGYLDPEIWHPGQPAPDGVFGAIRHELLRLHELAGNVADIYNKSLVIGQGGTQLLNAAITAIAKYQRQPQTLTAGIPYYYLVPGVADVCGGSDGFVDVVDLPSDIDPNALVEILTSPRNPDGVVNLTQATPAAYVIDDNVFAWPSFTDKVGPIDVEISIFSLSKLTGLSGGRLGWAFIKNPVLADLVADFIYFNTHGVSVDSQYRAAKVMQNMADDGGVLFSYVRETLVERWTWLEASMQGQTTFAVAGTFGFPVVWIDCLDFSGTDGCSNLFALAGLNVRPGSEFGMPGYVRMNLMVHQVTWELCQERLLSLFTSSAQKLDRMLELARTKPVHIPRYSS